jgi:hypothetical protein
MTAPMTVDRGGKLLSIPVLVCAAMTAAVVAGDVQAHAMAFPWWLALVPWLWVYFFSRRIRVAFDPAAGVRIETPKFPFGSKTVLLPADQVRGAELEETNAVHSTFVGSLFGFDRVFRVVMCTMTGERLPLTRAYSSGRRYHERWRDEINTALLTVKIGRST